jgi:hypothetical protein
MIKHLVVVMFIWGVSGAVSAENWLTENLSAVVSTGDKFRSESGTAVSGGGVRVRIRQERFQPISITPPSVTGGCNGIDVNFGGFSFVDGEEILTMLRTIAQGTTSQAFYIALTQGCPICRTALDKISSMSNWANELGFDTCQVSTELAGWAASSLTDAKTGACSAKEKDSAGNTNFFSSLTSNDGSCNSKEDAAEIIKGLKKNCNGLSGDALAECNSDNAGLMHLAGVSVFEYLKAMGKINPQNAKDMIYLDVYMSLAGTHVNGSLLQPTMSASDLVNWIMCGVEDSNGAWMPEDVLRTCEPWWDVISENGAGKIILTCVSGKDVHDEDSVCAWVESKDLDEYMEDKSYFVGVGEGLTGVPISRYGIVQNLTTTVDKVRTKMKSGESKYIPVDPDTGLEAVDSDNQLTTEEMNVLSSAPFPLYRLLNLEPYYDGIVDKLIGNSLGWVSSQIAQEVAKDLVELLNTMNTSIELSGAGDTVAGPSKEMDALFKDFVGDYTLEAQDIKDELAWREESAMRITQQIVGLEKHLLNMNAASIVRGMQGR